MSVSQLSQRTGVTAPTLRMWETRHGFPASVRSAGGHRRYKELEVERVRTVLRARKEGLSLAAAIRRSLATGPTASNGSIFAALAARYPELQPMTLCKPALLALTRAIEDEHFARAAGGVLIGSFQRARFYRQSERRWHELARGAELAVVLADFETLKRSAPRLVEVPLAHEHPLAREWSIAFHAPESSACLSAWEIPQSRPSSERDRRFEVLWSPEAEVAHAALELVGDTIATISGRLAAELSAELSPASPSTPELKDAVRQAHRMLTYIQAIQ